MKKVISIVLNNFKNDSRVLKENLSLKNNNYHPVVLALWEENLKEKEKIKDFDVHRIKLKTRKLPKNFFFNIIKFFELSFKIILKYNRSNIIHCNDLNSLPIGVIVKKFYNKDVKIVYDAHEHETEINGLKGKKKKFRKFLERSLIKYADRVITVSDSIAEDYARMYGIEKPAIVLNTPPYTEVEKQDIFREKFNIDKDNIIFLYQGKLSKGRGIEILVETFKSIAKDAKEKNINIPASIVFMGYGPLEDYLIKASKEYNNIYFHPAVSPNVLLNYTSSADFVISLIEDICLSYRYSLPNKMFEYIMAEVPLIVSNLPEMKKIVLDYNVGVVAKNNSIEGLKDAIKEATTLDKKELNSNLKKAKKVFNWEEQEKTLLQVYKSLD